MQARDTGAPVTPTALASEGAAEAALGEAVPQLRDILGPAEETALGMLDAEEALRLVRQRFEHTEDPELQGELAAEALDHVERQLALIHESRRRLDSAEAKLWARKNRLEGLLIHTRGTVWWHARRDRARTKALATERTSADPGNESLES
jgi:hypothetical protein